MSRKPLTLSIVIPAYNEEHHLQACLESIAAQTVRPDEVIVVDNGSTDRTAIIAQSFPFVKVLHENRRGVVFARNRGFDAARGDLIGRTDADIVLPSTWIEHVKQYFNKPNTDNKAWSAAGRFYNVRLPRLVSWAYQVLAFRLNRALLGHHLLWGSNMAIRRAQWQAVRGSICNRLDIHEDLDLALHIASQGYEIVHDVNMTVDAELRRVHDNRHQLWEYLQWWPRTLRVHGKKSWTICWFFGVLILYLAAGSLVVVDWLGHALDKYLPKTSQAAEIEMR